MSPRTTVFVLLLCLPAVFSFLLGRRSVEVDEEDNVALPARFPVPPVPLGRRFVGKANIDEEGDASEPRIGHRSVVKERFNIPPPPSGR